MKFVIEETSRGTSDAALLQELRRAAECLGKRNISMAEYKKIGKAHLTTTSRRFSDWNKALTLAGLEQGKHRTDITDNELFANLRIVWEVLGRQPRFSEVGGDTSEFCAHTYIRRFGS